MVMLSAVHEDRLLMLALLGDVGQASELVGMLHDFDPGLPFRPMHAVAHCEGKCLKLGPKVVVVNGVALQDVSEGTSPLIKASAEHGIFVRVPGQLGEFTRSGVYSQVEREVMIAPMRLDESCSACVWNGVEAIHIRRAWLPDEVRDGSKRQRIL